MFFIRQKILLILPDFFYYPIFNRSVGRWILAVLLFVALFSLKYALAKGVVQILQKLVFRKTTFRQSQKLAHRISWVFPLIAFRLADLLWIQADISIMRIINPILRSLTIIWLLLVSEILLCELVDALSHKRTQSFDATIHAFSLQMIRVCLVFLGIIMVLNTFNINVAALITGLGIGGLAVSMAAKDIIADLIGGFTIITEKIFEIGDHIANPNIEGNVEEIKFRQSKIRALDESLIIVPNSLLTENYIINYTKMGKRRVDLYVYLPVFARNEQIGKLTEYVKKYLNQHEKVLAQTQYFSIESIEKDALKFYIRYYLSDTDFDYFIEERDRVYKVIWQFLVENHLEKPYTRIEFIPEQFPLDKQQNQPEK